MRLGGRSLEDQRQIARWNGIVIKFKSKLVQMIKEVNSRFDYYFILSVIRQVLLHWGHALVEDDFL